jgi:hypothetical protein
MTAGGGADNDDLLRVEAELGSFGADGSKGTGGIVKHDGMAVALGTETILEDKCLEAPELEHPGKAFTFLAGKRLVTTTREDKDGAVFKCRSERFVDFEGGVVVGFSA